MLCCSHVVSCCFSASRAVRVDSRRILNIVETKAIIPPEGESQMRKQSTRALTFLLSVAVTISMSGTPVYAVADDPQPKTGLCEHHPEHTADCGYSEGIAAGACTHEHTDECYIKVDNCIHEHTDECYSQTAEALSDNTNTLSAQEEQTPDACTHTCSVESGCITEQLNCGHEHSEACGYVEGTEGTPCNYVCEICETQNDDSDEEDPSDEEKSAAVERVQAMIDELPDEVTEENAEEVEKMLEAIDEAKAELTAEEVKLLDLTRYKKALAALKNLSTSRQAMEETGLSLRIENDYGEKCFDNWADLIYWIRGSEVTTTITLLDDATITSPLTFTNVLLGDIILDLDGHTLSGDIADAPIIDVNPATIRSIHIQNGTIKNTHEGGRAIYLSDGKLTLKDVSATGDVVLGRIYGSSGNYVPTFLGGGTFSKIWVDENRQVNLSLILSRGCYVLDAAGQRLDANTNYSSLENVTIISCDHKNETGEYTFVKSNGEFVCTTCGNRCHHTDLTPDERMCLACGSEITATMTSIVPIQHYTSFSEAVDAVRSNRGDRTVHLLCDQDSSRLILGDQFTINLNGFTLRPTANQPAEVKNTVGFQNMDNYSTGHYTGTLLVNGTTSPIGIIQVPAENNNLRIDGLIFAENGTAELSGGTFGSITMNGDANLKDLLATGYYYKSATDGEPVDITGKTSLTEVTVTRCDHACGVFRVHDEASGTDTFTCPCGRKTFGASVTKDGQEAYYQTLQEAFDAATAGSTVKLLSKPTANTATLEVRSDITFDLNGQDLSSGAGLALNGKVTLIGSSAGSNLGIPVTVKSGAKMTVPATCSDSTANQLTLKNANITVAGGSEAELAIGNNENCSVDVSGRLTVTGGSYTTISLENNGEVNFQDGTCESLRLKNHCKANFTGGKIGEFHITGDYSGIEIADGSFDKIILYEYDIATDKPLRTVTYADFAALPGSGKAFRKTNNTWINRDDVKEYNLSSTKPCKMIEDVTVGDIPLGGVTAYIRLTDTDYPGPVSVEYGAQTDKEFSLRAKMQSPEGTSSSVTYQWYEIDADDSRTKAGSASSDGIYALSPTLALGEHTYLVEANLNGYLVESAPYTVTIVPRVLAGAPVADEDTLTKVYDGTTDTDLKITGFYASSSGTDPVSLTESDLQIDHAYYEAPAANDHSAIHWSSTLLNPNYTFDSKGSMTADGVIAASITKAPALTASSGELTVRNGAAVTYTYDFKSLLPEPESPKTYGKIKDYAIETIDLGSYYTDGAAITNGILSLPIEKIQTTQTGAIGTVTVKVSTQNYQDITLTLKVSAADKLQPTLSGNVTLSKKTLTYGQTLSAITITGKMKDGSKTVAGTFAWQSPDLKLNASENAQTAGWIFTPKDQDNYLEVTGTTEITVKKATLSGKPGYTPVKESGKTIADVPLTPNSNWPDGTLLWMDSSYRYELSSLTPVKANTTYHWVFEPNDKTNYESLRGTLKPYVVSTGGSGNSGSSANAGSSGTENSGSNNPTDSGSSGQGSAGNSGSTAGTQSPSQPRMDLPTTAETQPVTPDANGRATIDDSAIQAAINAAKGTAQKSGRIANGIAVTIPVTPGKGQTSFHVTLTAKALDALTNAQVKRLEISLDGVSTYCLNADLLKWLNSLSADGGILFRVDQVKKLPSRKAKTAIGNRPVYDLSLAYLNGKKEVPITDLDGHTITIRLPYTPAAAEQGGSLFAVYVNDAGKVEWLTNSSYHADLGAVIFETDHFSIYGIGYKKQSSSFKDISSHWAKDNILFVTSRDLLSGTGKKQFSPDAGITRGMFAAALGRLAEINPADYKTKTFTDVPANASYAPYVSWAADRGIIPATGETTFSPDASVTREEMAVIMANYAKATGRSLPAAQKAVTFTDHAQISSGAQAAVSATQQAGILAGKDGNRFDPQGIATRAEAATVLRQFIETAIDTQATQGWMQNHSGKWSYCKNGVMMVNTTVDGYKIDADGIRIER